MTSDAPPVRHTFPVVRDVAVTIARVTIGALQVEVLEQAIAEGDRALAVGPILDPTLARDAGPELEQHIALLRATLTYRQALEAFNPGTTPGDPQ